MRPVAAALAVAAAVTLGGCPDTRQAGTPDTHQAGTPSSLPACPSTDALFSVEPVALASVIQLTPLGNLNPPGHTFPTEHQYLYLLVDDGGQPLPVDVIAPGAVHLVEIVSSEHIGGGFVDYDLGLAPCDGVLLKLGHVATLDPTLVATLGGATGGSCETYSTGGETYRRCVRATDVALAAGARIGTAGGNPGQFALDLGMQDRRKAAAAYVNPAGYKPFLYSRCVLDYFEDAPRAALYGKVQRTAEPRCGTHVQDLAGTAQGNWRRLGAPTFPEDPHIALVHDLYDPTAIRLSIGTSFGIGTGTWAPAAASSGNANRQPQDVPAPSTGAWCWDGPGMRLVATFPGATTMRAQIDPGRGCGSHPWTVGPGALEFAR